MSLIVRRDGAVLTLALDRPDAGNRLDGAIIDLLTEAFESAGTQQDPPAVIVLTAMGDDFSLGRERVPGAPQNPPAITAEFQRIQRLNEAVQRCAAVTVAGLTGRAEGAGLSLAARCDIVVVADDAQLSFPEIPHGIPPTIVLSHYRYVLSRAILGDLIYTGRVLDGAEAVQFGLAARSVPRHRVSAEVQQIAGQVTGYDQASIALVKDFLSRTEAVPPTEAPGLGIAMYAVEMADRAGRTHRE
ncbi:MAG: enoyl-CoA hydratase/isomerase [Polaromonas sp.]|nr:enoyl-CoA hydratase/isomerase [Polaromonas sp.]